MFEIKKAIKRVLWVAIVCYFSFINGMESFVPTESVTYGIFHGEIESVKAGIEAGENVNEELFSPELDIWIKPLVLAIKCLNKAKDLGQSGYRLDIVRFLIHKGSDIDDAVNGAIDKVKDDFRKFAIQKLLIEHQQKQQEQLEKEFIELMEAIEAERQAGCEDDFEVIEVVKKKEPAGQIQDVSEKNVDHIDEANKPNNGLFLIIDDYIGN